MIGMPASMRNENLDAAELSLGRKVVAPAVPTVAAGELIAYSGAASDALATYRDACQAPQNQNPVVVTITLRRPVVGEWRGTHESAFLKNINTEYRDQWGGGDMHTRIARLLEERDALKAQVAQLTTERDAYKSWLDRFEAAQEQRMARESAPKPKPDADGWIAHDGKGTPAGLWDSQQVDFVCRSGYKQNHTVGVLAHEDNWFDWSRAGDRNDADNDIIAYRVVG